jgi:hypothetical protein
MSEPVANPVDIHAKAASMNLQVVTPKSDELFIDIDTEEDFKFFCLNVLTLQKHWPMVSFVWNPSKSGGEKKHITVMMPWPMTELERVCLQACLGSDRKRELLSFISLNHEPSCKPTCFFEKTDKPVHGGTNPNIYGGY